MKNILVCVLLITSLCSFTKKKKKPEPAFAKRSFTATVGTGWPNVYAGTRSKSSGLLNVGVDYQASKRWSFGLQYSFSHSKSEGHLYTYNGTIRMPTDSFLYQVKETYHVFMATTDFCYLNRGRVCLNSGIGVGYALQPTQSFSFPDGIDRSAQVREEGGILVFRVRLINAKVKIKENFGVYGSVGFGVEGLSVGATYTFKGRE